MDATRLEVLSNGRPLRMGTPVEFDELAAALRRAFEGAGEKVLTVRVAPDAPVERVQALQERIREAGALSISYSSRPN